MTSTRGDRILAGVVTTIVVGAVITAVVLLDPPLVQRQLDERRVEDLMSIQRAAEVYWARHKALPPDLAALGREPGLEVPAKDPETGAAYVYERTGARPYRLCAVFGRSTAERGAIPGYLVKWSHGSGRHCFDLSIPRDVDEPGSARSGPSLQRPRTSMGESQSDPCRWPDGRDRRTMRIIPADPGSWRLMPALMVLIAALGADPRQAARANPPDGVTTAPDAFEQDRRLGRGVNVMGHDPIWRSRDRGRFRAQHFRAIHEAGFQHVRINLHPFRDARPGADGTLGADYLKTLDWAVDEALASHLAVVLDFHEFTVMSRDPRPTGPPSWRSGASSPSDPGAGPIACSS
jgi:hypothetical protein